MKEKVSVLTKKMYVVKLKSGSLCIMIIFAYTKEISFELGNYLNKDHWYSIKQINLSKQDIYCQRYENFYH